MELTIKSKYLSIFLISCVVSTNAVVLLDIPYIRQFLGFMFLVLPGFLILRVLAPNNLSTSEKFVLSIGLSISSLLFFGVILNCVLYNFGYKASLSTWPIMFFIDLTYLIMVNGLVASAPSFNLNIQHFSNSEMICLSILVFFPLVSAFGILFMNHTNNNLLIYFLYVVIAMYVSLICIFNRKLPERMFPIIILLLSFSLTLLYVLRFPHIFGRDVHFEFFYFQKTLNDLHWVASGESLLESCLSVSILPTMFQSVMNTNNQEFLFRILPVLICSLTPVIIYKISTKYLDNIYSFLASFFFISQYSFLKVALNIRTNVAIFFVTLIILVLFNEKLSMLQKKLLSIIFFFSLVVSHYTTTYLFFYLILFSLTIILFLPPKYSQKKIMSMTSLLLFFAIIFFWYSLITSNPFEEGLSCIKKSIFSLVNLNFDSRYEGFSQLSGKGIEYGLVGKFNFVITWLSFIFSGIGILSLIKTYNELVNVDLLTKSKIFKKNIDLEYLFMSLGCGIILGFTVILPHVSLYYGLDRLYSFITIILSLCFIVGGIKISKSLKVNPLLIILLVLIPYFFITTNLTHQMAGAESSTILNSNSEIYVSEYVHDQDSYSAKWLSDHFNEEYKIHTDCSGLLKLISQGNGKISANSIFYNPSKKIESPNYTYLSYDNLINDNVLFDFAYQNKKNFKDSDFSCLCIEENKIYCNGGSEIYN